MGRAAVSSPPADAERLTHGELRNQEAARDHHHTGPSTIFHFYKQGGSSKIKAFKVITYIIICVGDIAVFNGGSLLFQVAAKVLLDEALKFMEDEFEDLDEEERAERPPRSR